MFGLKGRDTFNDPVSNAGKIIKSARKWWIKSFKYILAVLAIFVAGTLVYFWYSYLYENEVSQVETVEYVEAKKKEVILEKKKFDNANDLIDARGSKFNEGRQEYRDVFYEDKIDVESDV
ncbi:MAG: hypothetical protein ACKUBY_04940 [Candidatus Moraniibacteriota bacterium]|jgi:hypothetical protein